MEKSIRDRWNALPERGSITPDFISDADAALDNLRAARETLAIAETEYAAAIAKAYIDLSKQWTREELDAAGFSVAP